MDASAQIKEGYAGGKLTSSGYWPPELAKAVYNAELLNDDVKPDLPAATQAVDVSLLLLCCALIRKALRKSVH